MDRVCGASVPAMVNSRRMARALVLLCSILLCLPALATTTEKTAPESAACVVLLHGLGRSSLSMLALQWRLEDAGYAVVN